MLSELGLGAPRVLPSERTKKQRGKALEKKKKTAKEEGRAIWCHPVSSSLCQLSYWPPKELYLYRCLKDERSLACQCRTRCPKTEHGSCKDADLSHPRRSCKAFGARGAQERDCRPRWDQRVKESGPGWASSATGKTLALRCELDHEALNRKLKQKQQDLLG